MVWVRNGTVDVLHDVLKSYKKQLLELYEFVLNFPFREDGNFTVRMPCVRHEHE